jgi:hypothetical protein
MKNLHLLIIFVLSSCTPTQKHEGWRKLDIGEFIISVPSSTELENVESIDSYVAKIKGDGFGLMFDYGLYSPKMTLTEEEYLKEKEWEISPNFGLIKILEPIPTLDSLKKVNDSTYLAIYNASECLKNDSCHYYGMEEVFHWVVFDMKDSMIYANFTLPSSIKEYDFYVTETDSIFKRVFISKDINKYRSGVYVFDKNSCSDKWNCMKQLALWTSDSIKISKNDLVKMLQSVELK